MVEPYTLPHECEREGLARLLSGLDAHQRKLLRSYIWQVELGELTVTKWLAKRPISRSAWYDATEAGRYWGNAGFRAAVEAYKRAGLEWQTNQERRDVEAAQRKIRRAAPAAAERLVDQVGNDIGVFFKVVERWVSELIPTYEVLDSRWVANPTNPEGPDIQEWLVRAVTVDLDKLRDPKYSRWVREFSDSPKNGLSLKLYDSLKASESVLDRADKGTASKGEMTAVVDLGRFEEALRRAYGDEAQD